MWFVGSVLWQLHVLARMRWYWNFNVMRVPVLLSTAAFLFEVARCSSEKYLKSFVIRNSDIYLGKALKDCCACDVFPKISLFFLHSWRWRMRTLLMYFSNRLEDAVLKWNANSLKNVDTNIFMLIIVIFFLCFYFSLFLPLCAHINARLFPT